MKSKQFLRKIEEKALRGVGISPEEATLLTGIPGSCLFDIIAASDRVRRHFKGSDINLCSIVNAKSGLCAEDCSFCAQSRHYNTGIESYPMLPAERIVASALECSRNGAREFSIVTSGTGIGKARDLDVLAESIKGINKKTDLETCASLGIMDEVRMRRLKEAGLHSYHHNLETSRTFFKNICTTHEYEEDVNTIRLAKRLGFYVCSGGIFGLGESWEQRIELAMTLRELDADSIPINFLNPRPGTPLEGVKALDPIDCLRIISLYRFMLPSKDIVICGGREVNLKDLQCLIFAAGANGMMIGNYLTTKGREPDRDIEMIECLGLKPRR